MEIITIETQSTPDRNVSYVKGRVGNFDLIGINRGISLWIEQFNSNNVLFDASYVQIDGPEWTEWPAGLTDEQDYEYVSTIILKKLGLNKRSRVPYFVTFPSSQVAIENSNVDFSGAVKGYPENFSYQWFYNDSIIPGATGNVYSINNVSANQTGYYNLSVNNSCGSVTGSAYLEILSKTAPYIINQPKDLSVVSGGYGQLTVLANGVPNPNYQWYKNDQIIDNAISTSLIFANMQEGDAGVYHVVVSNSQGSVESNRVDVSINTDENLFQQYIFQ